MDSMRYLDDVPGQRRVGGMIECEDYWNVGQLSYMNFIWVDRSQRTLPS